MDLLLIVSQKVKKEKIAEVEKAVELDSKVKENKIFIIAGILSNDSFLKKDNINNNGNWLD